MPQYLVERNLPGAGKLTPEQLKAIAQKSNAILTQLGPKIQWLHSFVTDDKVYCVYLAPDEATIRKHAKMIDLPANRISAVRHLLDPSNFG